MKVLFICPRFFGYEKNITDALLRQGHEVTYYDEKPYNNVIFKIVLRLWKNSLFVRKIIDKYFTKILKESPSDIDVVIVLKGESLTDNIVAKIRNKYSEAKFVFYAWDSIINYPHVHKYLYQFDKVFTFDSHDALTHDNMELLPLFFSPEFTMAASVFDNINKNKKKISFLGTVHSDRYELLGEIYKKYKNEYDLNFILYFPSVIVLLGFLSANIKNIIKYKLYTFSLRSRSKTEMANLFLSSNAVLDIQHPGQSGLTMRTLECMPLQRKMITTNTEIKKYPFYSPQNYMVLNRQKLEIDPDFLDTIYDPLEIEIIDRYSVDTWVRILCE